MNSCWACAEKAMKKNKHWKIKYYLGLIKWHFRDFDDAKKLFSDCGNEPDYAPFYAARAELLKNTMPTLIPPPDSFGMYHKYLTDLERAASLDPKQWRYGKSLIIHFIEQKNPAKALEIADKYRKMLPNNYYLGLQYAKTLLLNDKFKEGVAYMRNLKVLPNEGATDGRMQHVGRTTRNWLQAALTDAWNDRWRLLHDERSVAADHLFDLELRCGR